MKTKTEQKQEIINTRVGGFGGSDAKMFFKVGLNGLSAWWINRSETIKRAACNSRAARGLSRFSKDRDEKK